MTALPEARAGSLQAIARLGKRNVRLAAVSAQAVEPVDEPASAVNVETDSDAPLDSDDERRVRVPRNQEARKHPLLAEDC